MPTIEIDFESYKELVRRRPSETVSEADVIRDLLFGKSKEIAPTPKHVWVSEGVDFWVGTKLRHRFRNGTVAEAEIADQGVKVGDKTFGGVSPAAADVAGHQANGWQFWEYEARPGYWVKIDTLRS